MVEKTKKQQLIKYLTKLKNMSDKELNHRNADIALLEFINDKEITYVYDKIEKWYA